LTISKKLTLASLAVMVLTLLLSFTALATMRTLGGKLETAVNTDARAEGLLLGIRLDLEEMSTLAKDTQSAYVMESVLRIDPKVAGKPDMPGECSSCHAVGSTVDRRSRFDLAAARATARVREVRSLLPDTQSVTSLEKIGPGITEWQRLYSSYLEFTERAAFGPGHSLVTDRMNPLLETLSAAAAALEERENAALANAKADAAATLRRSRVMVFALIAASILCGIVIMAAAWQVKHILLRIASELFDRSAGVARYADQVGEAGQALAAGACEQVESLEATTASAQLVMDEVRKNAGHSSEVASAAEDVLQRISTAQAAVEQMAGAMGDIDRASAGIADILKVIDNIAFQTKLLALNAAIEAAAAGSAGVGFAVVAEQVRQLAHRSAGAASKTDELIDNSREQTRKGSQLLGGLRDEIRGIAAASESVARLAEKVRAGSGTQAQGIEEIGRTLSKFERITQRSAASAEEGASIGSELSSQAEALNSVVDRLRRTVA
jgi:hypothetical protein